MTERFTEGYLKEIRFASIDVTNGGLNGEATRLTVVIDPASPFSIEYKEGRYILVASKAVVNGECRASASLYKVDTTWNVDEKMMISDRSLSLIAIKTAHMKCRFGINGHTIVYIYMI